MSSATPPQRTPVASSVNSVITACIDRVARGVRAVAFWAAALLPLAILFGLATGAASQYPTALLGALTLNAVCAVIGHHHTPHQ